MCGFVGFHGYCDKGNGYYEYESEEMVTMSMQVKVQYKFNMVFNSTSGATGRARC